MSDDAKASWALVARRQKCAVCENKRGLIRGHHVITQQALRRLCKDAGLTYEVWRWDQRNMLPMCDECHERHHGASARVTLGVLRKHAPQVIHFARDIDSMFDDGRAPAQAFLDRHYPAAA